MYPFYPTDPTEKSVIYLSFTLEIPVFWHFLYRVHLVWDLRFGFLASLDITWHGTRLKKYLQFWSCHHLLSWWSTDGMSRMLQARAQSSVVVTYDEMCEYMYDQKSIFFCNFGHNMVSWLWLPKHHNSNIASGTTKREPCCHRVTPLTSSSVFK